MEDPEINRKDNFGEEIIISEEEGDEKFLCCYCEDKVRTMEKITSSTVIFSIIAMIIVLIILLARLNDEGISEEAFFAVLADDGLWKEIKKWMYPYSHLCDDLKISNYYEYKNGDSAVFWDYVGLVLEKEDLVYTNSAIDNAACNNNFKLLQWIYENKTKECTSFAMLHAASHNNIEMLNFLHINGKECTKSAMDEAASSGAIEALLFLHYNRFEGCTTDAMDKAAASGGYLEVVEFLHRFREEGCTTNAIDNAAEWGHLEIIKFLLTNRTEGFTIKALEEAAGSGDLEILELLYPNRREGWDLIRVVNIAAKGGHLDIVKFFYDRGIKCSTYGF